VTAQAVHFEGFRVGDLNQRGETVMEATITRMIKRTPD
jgi:hypothetical protein